MKLFKVTIEMELGVFSFHILAQSTYHAIELAMFREGFFKYQQDRDKYQAKKV